MAHVSKYEPSVALGDSYGSHVIKWTPNECLVVILEHKSRKLVKKLVKTHKISNQTYSIHLLVPVTPVGRHMIRRIPNECLVVILQHKSRKQSQKLVKKVVKTRKN